MRTPSALHSIIDKERLFAEGASEKGFLKNYHNLRLDAVSLAAARQEALSTENSALYDKRLQS